MATANKTSQTRRRTTRPSAPTPIPTAIDLPHRLGESAQHVWLAGLGALGRAQNEGSRWFNALVKEGKQVERGTRRKAREQVKATREAVDEQLQSTRQKASAGMDRIGGAIDAGMRGVLHRLHIPDRNEVEQLKHEVQKLNARLASSKTSSNNRRTAGSKRASTRAPKQPESTT